MTPKLPNEPTIVDKARVKCVRQGCDKLAVYYSHIINPHGSKDYVKHCKTHDPVKDDHTEVVKRHKFSRKKFKECERCSVTDFPETSMNRVRSDRYE